MSSSKVLGRHGQNKNCTSDAENVRNPQARNLREPQPQTQPKASGLISPWAVEGHQSRQVPKGWKEAPEVQMAVAQKNVPKMAPRCMETCVTLALTF